MPTVDESVSQAIDVFHLPSGVDVSDYEIYEVATSDGVKRLRYPRLDGPKVTSLAKQLADVRNRTLAAMSVNDILDIVADAAQLWADPDFELRRQAELLIPAITGYEPDMVRIELKRYMRQFRRRELLRFLDSEIGQPSMLDEFRPNKAGGYSKYVGPALTYQVFSSNVPGIPVWSMAMTLLVKGAILGKSSFSEPVMPAFFARSIAMVNSDLADALRWFHGRAARSSSRFSHRCGRCRDCLRFFADYQIDCGQSRRVQALSRLRSKSRVGVHWPRGFAS